LATPAPQQAPESRIAAVDLLRGVAALFVVWTHYGAFSGWMAEFGRAGVILFFIISGFVIPTSLERYDYSLRLAGPFLLKRFLRLYPAYLATIGFIVALACVKDACGLKPPTAWDLSQVVDNMAFVGNLSSKGPMVSVFWTLAIEWQYYFFVAIAYPILRSRRALDSRLLMGAMCLAGVLSADAVWVAHWLPSFAIGFALYLWRMGRMRPKEAALFVAAGMLIVAWQENPATAFLIAAAGSLFWLRRVPGVSAFLGAVSYSLYLIHVPVGQEISERAYRWFGFGPWGRLGQFILILGATLAAATLLWRLVDERATRWSSKVSLRAAARQANCTNSSA
jgi:peptidoglycan/LPS O-acetylase OafA/YrhL